MRKKEKWTNKENDKHENADFFSTIQLVISNVCTKFQIPGKVVAEKFVTKKNI